MAYQALARKWRPKTFVELVGQEHVVTALTNALITQRLHHAYLFTGTRGVGKTTLARILAKALNCESGVTASPCGICGACKAIDSGSFVDLLEVDAATNTRVEEMRELLDNTQYMPTLGRFKVYIIDEVHMLSRSAFNSMLKTLEEPPEHVKFILATTDPQKVPVTVLSRCLQFNLKQMPREAITGHLARVLAAEQIIFDEAALQALARAAQGSMRDSLSLLDQAIAFGNGTIGSDTVSSMLGTIDQTYVLSLLEHIANRNGKALLEEAERMAERSLSFETALQELATVLHRIALQQTVPESAAKNSAEHGRIEALASLLSLEDVQLFYQIAITGRRDLPLAPDEFAGFTIALMRMLAFAMDVPAKGKLPRSEQAESSPSTDPASSVAAELVPAGISPISPTAGAKASTFPAMGADGLAAINGNWLQLVADLKLAGMAGMLASHCELVAFSGSRIELLVPAEHKHLADKVYIEKLRNALGSHLKTRIDLRVTLGVSNGNTLAEVNDREQKLKQAEAVEAIEGDVFVRELVENLDARLIESSIRPINSRSSGP